MAGQGSDPNAPKRRRAPDSVLDMFGLRDSTPRQAPPSQPRAPGTGSTPNTPQRPGAMLGLGGSTPQQAPPPQPQTPASGSSNFSFVQVGLDTTPNPRLASLLVSDPVSNPNGELPVSPDVSLDEFADICRGLIDGHDPRRNVLPAARSVRLPKTQLSVTPYQLVQAWKMLNQRERTSGLRGGMQASETGLGKTYIVISYVTLRSRMFESARQVKEFWGLTPATRSSRRARHLPRTARGDGLKCPSQDPGDVVCFCVPTSKARAFVDSGVAPRGAALIQAPFPVVQEWVNAFGKANLDASAYNLVISYTSDVPARLRGNFTLAVQSLIAQSGSSQAPETYIFCAPHTSERVAQTFTSADHPIAVGTQIIDESHQAMETRAMAIAQSQAGVSDGLDLWCVSGTPIKVLKDFDLLVRLWSTSSDLARCTAMAQLVTAYNTARCSEQHMERFLGHWRRVFDNSLVLRLTVGSKFHNMAITGLRPSNPDKIWMKTPQQHINAVQAVAHLARGVFRERARVAKENEEVFKPDYTSGIDARLDFVSMFPGAAAIIERGELNVAEDEVRRLIVSMNDPNKLNVEGIAIFQEHLEEAAYNSPKLDFILAEIGRMRADRKRRKEDPDRRKGAGKENLSLKKMTIITPTLGTAVMLYLYILKRLPGLNPVCFHTGASLEDREAALQSFQTLTDRKTAKHSYVFITPFSVGGTGLNLQSANYQIFTSPPRSRVIETQGFARTNRTGQRLRLHHSTLIMQDNPADRIHLASYASRSVLGDPFDDISRDLVLAEPNGSKKVQRLSDWGYTVNAFDFNFDIVGEIYPGAVQEHDMQASEIKHPSALGMDRDRLDRLQYFDTGSALGATLGISEAWQKYDQRPRYEVLPLRDVLLGFWVHELKRRARSLNCLIYFTVIEEALQEEYCPRVYAHMGVRRTEKLLIRRLGSPQEQEAFAMLLNNTPFCAGAQKMLDEYSEFSGVEIESFEFLPDEIDEDFPHKVIPFNFRITLTQVQAPPPGEAGDCS